MIIKFLMSIFFIIVFTSCSSMKIEDFSDSKIKFIPQEYFNGKMTAYGIVKDSTGKITRSFKGELFGSWDSDGVGTLDEYFTYSDGEKLRRTWKLVPTSQNSFIGTAGDIVGEAPMLVNGNTIMIDYTMRIPYGDSTLDVNVRDWLHLQEDGIIINHSKIKKFGFEVGELVITIIKEKESYASRKN